MCVCVKTEREKKDKNYVGNRHDDLCSNPRAGCSYFTYR